MSRPVWFSEDQYKAFQGIANSGIVSQSFSDFVKTAFHNRVDHIKRGVNDGNTTAQ